MRKNMISFFTGVVAAFVLTGGVLMWLGAGVSTTTSAFAGSTIDPSAMMTSTTGLPTSHYDAFSELPNSP